MGDLGFDAVGRCGDAPAQRCDYQLLGVGGDDLGCGRNPDPARHGEGLNPDLVVAQGPELGCGPGDGSGVARRAGKSRPHLGGQRFEKRIGAAAGQRCVSQARSNRLSLGGDQIGLDRLYFFLGSLACLLATGPQPQRQRCNKNPFHEIFPDVVTELTLPRAD